MYNFFHDLQKQKSTKIRKLGQIFDIDIQKPIWQDLFADVISYLNIQDILKLKLLSKDFRKFIESVQYNSKTFRAKIKNLNKQKLLIIRREILKYEHLENLMLKSIFPQYREKLTKNCRIRYHKSNEEIMQEQVSIIYMFNNLECKNLKKLYIEGISIINPLIVKLFPAFQKIEEICIFENPLIEYAKSNKILNQLFQNLPNLKVLKTYFGDYLFFCLNGKKLDKLIITEFPKIINTFQGLETNNDKINNKNIEPVKINTVKFKECATNKNEKTALSQFFKKYSKDIIELDLKNMLEDSFISKIFDFYKLKKISITGELFLEMAPLSFKHRKLEEINLELFHFFDKTKDDIKRLINNLTDLTVISVNMLTVRIEDGNELFVFESIKKLIEKLKAKKVSIDFYNKINTKTVLDLEKYFKEKGVSVQIKYKKPNTEQEKNEKLNQIKNLNGFNDYMSGRYKEAIDKFEELIENSEMSLDLAKIVHFYLASSFFRLKKFSESLECIENLNLITSTHTIKDENLMEAFIELENTYNTRIKCDRNKKYSDLFNEKVARLENEILRSSYWQRLVKKREQETKISKDKEGDVIMQDSN